MACGILVTWARMEPVPPPVEWSPNHWITRNSPRQFFFVFFSRQVSCSRSQRIQQNPNPQTGRLSGKPPTPPLWPLGPQTQGINSCLIKTDLDYWDNFLKTTYLSFIVTIVIVTLSPLNGVAVLDLRGCVRAFSSCGDRVLLFLAVRGLLIVVASRCGAWAPECRLSSSGTRT